MEQTHVSGKPFKEHLWIAFIVQTILVVVFELLGCFLGVISGLEISNSDFPLDELIIGFLIGFLIGLVIGGGLGVVISRRFWIRTFELKALTMFSMMIGTLLSALLVILYFFIK